MYVKVKLHWTFLIESYPDGVDQRNVIDGTPIDRLKRMGHAMDIDNNGMLLLHHACNNENYLHAIPSLIWAHPEGSSVLCNI
mmetsp:Transcript_22465/g.32171  ORF Transcript_22465/g.32171 Transcript_22465/m.32171 type:complete len:82 (-) Transcript_22465:294-539(-)